jgi:hypothetical protein
MIGEDGAMIKPLLAALCALSAAAASPADAATRNFAITSFDRVRIDGPYRVRLATGVAPFASATGSAQALDAIALDVQGRTLVVHVNRGAWGGFSGQSAGPVTIDLGTHDLNAAWLNGSGSLAIDRVSGLSFDLSVQGSGLASIDQVSVDQLRVGLGGAASARLAGSALRLSATVRGASSLDAAALAMKDITVSAEGPAIVKGAVSGTAKVDAFGVAAVTLTGSPACVVKTQGSATVEGCREAQ